jgi:tetratricopeptide (TPR) repeat protein
MDRAALAVPRPRGLGPTTTWIWSARLAAADLLGRAVAWLVKGGRLVLLALVAIATVVLLGPVTYWQALLGAAIVLLLVAAARAHVRVVIEGFDDYRKPREDGSPVKDASTAVLLANRLTTMRELYGFVDDPDGTPTPDRPPGATVQLDDAASVLRSAVTTDSTVSFGPISIPLGAVMALLGRLVQAPRLRGGIHGDDRKIIVTAELVMDGQPYAWRVERAVEDGTTARRRLESMVHDELAYQVFSDLTLQRQARWPATKFWLLALGNLADGQRRPRNRRLLLKQAESNFMQALSEDERFYLACLNLGIVYRRLAEYPGQPADRSDRYMLAARRVFERAIDLRPDRWEAYHALAEAHWGTQGSVGALEMIEGLCERALSREPDRAASARILDLEGHVQAKARAFGPATRTRRRACRLALTELGRTRLRQAGARQAQRLQALENQAAQCLVNLASTSWSAHRNAGTRDTALDLREFRRAYRIARLAARLSDIDASAHHQLARLALETGQLGIAVEELSAAARIAPADPLYAADLALALAKTRDLGRAAEARARAERLIDFGDPGQKRAQDSLIEAYRTSGERADLARAEALETRKALSDELEECEVRRPHDRIAALAGLLRSLGRERDWETARVHATLGRAIREGPGEPEERSEEADGHFREALEWFAANQPDDSRLAELHSDRAQALALRPACSGEALVEAENAVILNPLHAGCRTVLARVYEVGGDLVSACSAAEAALMLDPDDATLHHRLAMLRWRLAESLADAAAHDAERARASAQFEEALVLYASDQRNERRTTSWWLAMSYFAMSDFVEVPAHLRFVLASIVSDRGATVHDRGLNAAAELWLAKTYRKLGKFLEAEAHAREAVEVARQLDEDRVPLTQGLTELVDDDRWPLWVVLALGHMQLAGCHADRDGNLDLAEESLKEAEAVFERTKEDPATEAFGSDTYAEYLAEYGRLQLALDKPIDAIDGLRRSADIDPDEADVYLDLARAHARAAEQQVESDWQAHIRHALAACRRTEAIGGPGHPDTKEAVEVERQLHRLEAAAAEKSAPAETNGKPAPEALAGATPPP